jgi:hypothetical protein
MENKGNLLILNLKFEFFYRRQKYCELKRNMHFKIHFNFITNTKEIQSCHSQLRGYFPQRIFPAQTECQVN